jgi:hypothetical protein
VLQVGRPVTREDQTRPANGQALDKTRYRTLKEEAVIIWIWN